MRNDLRNTQFQKSKNPWYYNTFGKVGMIEWG